MCIFSAIGGCWAVTIAILSQNPRVHASTPPSNRPTSAYVHSECGKESVYCWFSPGILCCCRIRCELCPSPATKIRVATQQEYTQLKSFRNISLDMALRPCILLSLPYFGSDSAPLLPPTYPSYVPFLAPHPPHRILPLSHSLSSSKPPLPHERLLPSLPSSLPQSPSLP
jgi:hypothetical protein